MASLEDLMAGMFGGNTAPGSEDERKRRGQAGGGVGGAAVTPGQLLPYFTNQPVFDYSGPMAARMGGRGGLMSLLGGKDVQGPALRHFQNQGFDFMPPGLVDNPGIGGPNVAPGNLDNGQAIDQPQANPTPGVPRGVAAGQAPGRSQGWRNLAGGYSAAAQFGYGTPEFGRNFAPGTPLPPGATGPGSSGYEIPDRLPSFFDPKGQIAPLRGGAAGGTQVSGPIPGGPGGGFGGGGRTRPRKGGGR